MNNKKEVESVKELSLNPGIKYHLGGAKMGLRVAVQTPVAASSTPNKQ